MRTNFGIDGVVVRAPALESDAASPIALVGRFGWKSQHSSLLSACADSLRNDLGIRNRLYPDEYATHQTKDGPTPLEVADARTGRTGLRAWPWMTVQFFSPRNHSSTPLFERSGPTVAGAREADASTIGNQAIADNWV